MPKTIHGRIYQFLQSIPQQLTSGLSIGAKIYFAGFLTISVVIVTFLFNYVSQNQLFQYIVEFQDQRLPAMQLASKLKSTVVSHNNAVLRYVMTKSPKDLSNAQNLKEQALLDINRLRIQTNNPTIKERLNLLRKETQDYFIGSQSFKSNVAAETLPEKAGLFQAAQWARNQAEQRKDLKILSSDEELQLNRIFALCDEIVTYHRAGLAQSRLETNNMLTENMKRSVALTVASVIFVLFIVFGLAIAILGSLRLLLNGVKKIEEGDLNFEIPIRSDDELGKFTMAFNRMRVRVKNQNDQLRKQSITDELTSAYNQRYLRVLLKQEYERAVRTNRPLSMLMIDVDYFKVYNDKNGHELGNEVLKGVARTIREHLRTNDYLARYGGDEFSVLLPNATAEETIEIANRLSDSLKKSYYSGQEDMPMKHISLSIGGATFPGNAKSSQELLLKADEALYEAKKAGRGCWRWSTNKVDKSQKLEMA